MKAFRVEWKVRDFSNWSKWFASFDKANKLQNDLEDAALLLKLTFESRPAVLEVEIEE